MVAYVNIPPSAIKIDLPNTFQLEDYTCGPAALMAIFAYYGVGPEEEWELEEHMGIDEEGSDPKHILRAVKRYGLAHREFSPMTVGELVTCLDDKHPVMIMLQAWGDRRSYDRWWVDGHWIVAIGYDRRRIYFEDPAIYRGRGYLDRAELERRWHDVEGPGNTPTEHYGIAIWKPGVEVSRFPERARRIA
jgi:predicted double-glycine peptidase